jgi:phosphonate transport system ATP-binding protein
MQATFAVHSPRLITTGNRTRFSIVKRDHQEHWLMLEMRRVRVTYPGGLTALQPTNLAFREGDFTVLLGPSGAGKSTLLRCLNGLVVPTSGEILSGTFGSILSSRASLRRLRARTGMVFQQHQLIGRLSALTNVLTGRLASHGFLRTLLPMSRADRYVALSALERVGLVDRALERADRLSGGQQQRVGIARALAQEPRLILADEPVASLDPATAVSVLGLLHDICKADGITAIVSLHQVDLARRFADRIVGLRAGAIVFDSEPARLTDAELDRIYVQAPGGIETQPPPRAPTSPFPVFADQPA